MKKHLAFLCGLLLALSHLGACSKKESIYNSLGPEEDGVISVIIPEGENEIDADQGRQKEPIEPLQIDELNATEKQLVIDLHESEFEKLSFFVVDAESDTIVKSYLAGTPRRLASITKFATSLAALEEVNNVSVSKVAAMLKNSVNGEASRYLHLAAKAINGTTIADRPYTDAHDCPDGFLNEGPLASVVFDWLVEQLPDDDWTDAALHDGAGCHYDNFMKSTQIIRILQLADSFGNAYAGKSYEELLSISGTDGTWKSRNKDHKGRIFAKTGTLNPTSNLAGYFYAKRNNKMRKYYFGVFVEKKGSGQYTTKSRELIESLLRHWINYFAKNKGPDLGALIN